MSHIADVYLMSVILELFDNAATPVSAIWFVWDGRTTRNSRQVWIVTNDLYIFFAFSGILMEKLGKTMILFVRIVHIVPGVRTMHLQSTSIVCYHSLTFLFIPRIKVLLDQLTGLQLVKKFPAFYGTRRFITAFTSTETCAYPELAQSSPYPHIPLPDPSEYYPSIYAWVSSVVSFPQVSLLPLPAINSWLSHPRLYNSRSSQDREWWRCRCV
jgi:hypothetical protein